MSEVLAAHRLPTSLPPASLPGGSPRGDSTGGRSRSPARDQGSLSDLENSAEFQGRHIGLSSDDERRMLDAIGEASCRSLVDGIVPASIARKQAMKLPPPLPEAAALAELEAIAAKNRLLKSFIGQGYHGTHTPGVILRNILENPAWYTAYTPYQAEIAQGRMEAILNFQTMVCDLTAMPIANASLLDEATACAEAMTLARRSSQSTSNVFLADRRLHPQSLEVLRTRAEPLGIEIVTGDIGRLVADRECFGAIVQYPTTDGEVIDHRGLAEAVHARKGLLCVAADLLALTLLVPPGEWGADIVVGTTQRFGMPMGCGGPHAAFFACRDEFKRSMPGRLVGVSIDSHGRPAYRLALQTREQHIRREKATSNICTSQALNALAGVVYLAWLGRNGITELAELLLQRTAYAREKLNAIEGVNDLTGGHVVREFAVDLDVADTAAVERVISRCQDRGVNPGFAVGREYEEFPTALLVAIPGQRTPEEIDLLADVLAESLAAEREQSGAGTVAS